MKSLACSLLLATVFCVCVAHAQQPDEKSTSQPTNKSSQQSSPPQVEAKTMPQPRPEMQKLLAAFSGTWSITAKYEPSERMLNGGTGEGQEMFRPGPGGLSMLEDEILRQATGETSGLSVTWWDGKAQGYRAIWCDNKNPGGCIIMARLAKWEGDQFVLGDEFTKDGTKFIFKEVVSDLTPTSFTQTIYQSEAGKELTRVLTIHATKVTEATTTPTINPKQ